MHLQIRFGVNNMSVANTENKYGTDNTHQQSMSHAAVEYDSTPLQIQRE